MEFKSSIDELPLAQKYKKKLKKLGLKKISDLLFHFPHRYEDFSNLKKIKDVRLNENVCIQGKILDIQNERSPRKKIILTKAIVKDKTGAIKVVWFNQPYLINVLKKGDNVALAGKIVFEKEGIYLQSPAYEKILPGKELIHTGRIVPVYPGTEKVSSKWLRWLLKKCLQKFGKKIPETLPQQILEKEKLLPLSEALFQIHFPENFILAKKAQERFQFEELFLIQLFVLREKLKLQEEKAPKIPINENLLKKFTKSLPFELTLAQKKSAWQILKDLEKSRPMNRLLEGDVGSGKTVVAAICALNVAKAGYQVAFMAPTEILARQHFKEIFHFLKDFELNLALLTAKSGKIVLKNENLKIFDLSKEEILKKTKEGKIDILIGTHALIQEKVKFGKLGLVILDEQHRFGVEQRAKLLESSKSKSGKIPHLLSMTATPIPRTLALTIYGDLDLSLIDQLPKGRKKVITKVVKPEDRKKIYDFVKKEIKKGRQVFVICPCIETKEKKEWEIEIKAVEKEYERLSKEIFPEFKIGKLYGKMSSKEKEKIMEDFKNKKIDILVSTSVVEVGIDVPSASVMIIEGAERFGLAQLYQFRGRVGRSHYQSYCFLLSESFSQKTKKRLEALLKAKNSFELAEKDLEIRGPGDFIGKRQWGIPDLAMSALKNLSFVKRTRECAKEILQKDPKLENFPELRKRLEKFREKVHLE